MFQLTNPLWLFAIAALAIPVVIHLWNIRPGKTLKVGSIALIEAASRKSSRSFNLLDVLLLLLRCLLLLLLAFLLVQPFWSKTTESGKLKGWVLIPKQNLHQVYTQFKSKVDSLTKSGYQLRYFNAGFENIDTAILKTGVDSSKSNTVKNWLLVKQLEQSAPAGIPLYVFAPNALGNLGGTRPQAALNLQTQYYTPADSTSLWLQNANYVSTGDAVKIAEGDSKPLGTVFNASVIQATEQTNSPYQVNINNGKPSVSYKTSKDGEQSLAVDTSTLCITIYGGKNANDANYLAAALMAVKQFTQRKIQIVKASTADAVSANQNWLFWLSEQPVPTSVKAKTDKIFIYENGKLENSSSQISIPGIEKITLSKRIASSYPKDETLWQDGFGAAVLSRDDQNVYHFYSRFNPFWNDLVWSSEFPKVMLNLLVDSAEPVIYVNDKRVADNQQLQPILIRDKTSATMVKIISQIDLSKAFWIALVSIFLIERLLAYRTKSIENYG